MEKWRGIKTTSKPKNTREALTITNRLGQKSMSLPWITDSKRWAGFPGLAGTARKIAKLIPECKYYVEPFAGSAKVYQEMSIGKFHYAVLNDKSKYIVKWLKKEFPYANVTNYDFKTVIKRYDSRTTFFLIDPPWYRSYYDQIFSIFNRPSVAHYDQEVLDLCEKLKGKFIITTRKENQIMRRSRFNHKLIKSEYVVSGKYPKVLLTTNLRVRRSK